jgi:cytochrome c biogenesis protein CcmG, thiol:disulfide interchange protein DsbE
VIDASGIIRYRHVGEVNSRVWNGALGQTYRALAAP